MTRGFMLLLVATLAIGCDRDRSRPQRQDRTRRPSSHRPRPPRPTADVTRVRPATAAQRAYDGQRRAALLAIVARLDERFRECLALATRGARDPAFRNDWPRTREAFVGGLGELRAKILAVDPLGSRSWAAGVANRLLHYLTVRLPDAIWESWRSQPSGALATRKSDFGLISGRLRRYVERLNPKPSRTPKKDVP
ncbi:MAG: hypothetical protein ABI333_10445 [bacterium]